LQSAILLQPLATGLKCNTDCANFTLYTLTVQYSTIIVIYPYHCRSPDTGPLKKKMVYSSTKDAVQKKFVGVGAVFEAHDRADLNYDEMAAEIEKKA